MDHKTQVDLVRRLEHELRVVDRIEGIPNNEIRLSSVYEEICSIVFGKELYQILWDEPTLSLVCKLFERRPPGSTMDQEIAKCLKDRFFIARRINDLFFAILDSDTDERGLEEKLMTVLNMESNSLNLNTKLGNNLHDIRTSQEPPSAKVRACLDLLTKNLKIDFGNYMSNIEACLDVLRNREQIGMVNALLVNPQTNTGAVIPLHVMIQPGTGGIDFLTQAQQNFKTAIERAMRCLQNEQYLQPNAEAMVTLDVTDAEYVGSSIALAAAIAMWYSAIGAKLDPYTAFSGDINMVDAGFVVRSVEGIPFKLHAARAYGCRRVFVPKENQMDISASDAESLRVIFIDHVAEAIAALQMPGVRAQGEGLNVRKIASLQTFCREQGWQLSDPQQVQGGYQFDVAPPNPPNVKVTVYDTGTHVPKDHSNGQLSELLAGLNKLDVTTVPIMNVNEVFMLQDIGLRRKIQQDLENAGPVESRQEQHCDYSLRFEDGKQVLRVKQYTSGKLVLQGNAGDLYKRILEIIVTEYNLKNPQAKLKISSYLAVKKAGQSTPSQSAENEEVNVTFPYIGTDESGKGDYFGPLVSAGVYVDERYATELAKCGVKDSKQLSDNRNLDLAQKIAKICKNRYTIIEISPEKYNDLYEQFTREGKNLNSLLAWGHAKALEEILSKVPCAIAVADQFADERFIISKLQEKGKDILLKQMHKAEMNIGVAAASILARARFLDKLSKLSREYGVTLHKGASEAVVEDARVFVHKHGNEALRKVAKLHFKTTSKVTAK